MKKLPIGIQNIKEIIEEGYVYIDKTKYIYKLIESGKYYFISRPRRFGKSLTMSTLYEVFRGTKELFKNLWIFDKIEWKKYPVILIDFNVINHGSGLQIFKDSLSTLLKEIASKYEMKIEQNEPKDILKELVEKLGKKEKVVLLIDEYDKPIIDYMNNIENATKNKEFLSSFYEVIKGLDKYLKFVMLTGVSKFSRVSIFSKLNNLRDITLSAEYSELCGITEDELYSNFDEHIKVTSKSMKITEDELKNMMRKWYNGYSWDGEKKVYNPFSILNFFGDKRFRNYWFDSGTPTFLINHMRKNNYELTQLERKKVGEYVFNSYELDNLDVNCLLFQTGYTTIEKIETKHNQKLEYTLSVPNFEVKDSLINSILGSFSKEDISVVTPPYVIMLDELEIGNVDKFIEVLSSSFASLPFNLYPKAEDYYHSIFYLMMVLLGAKIDAEVLTDKGRIDGLIEFSDRIYVIEFKLGTSQSAMKQIKERKYYEKYMSLGKKIILLGIGGFEKKSIEYKLEELK